MWFEKLTGFKEESPDQVRSNIEINGNVLSSKINGASYQFGNLSVISLADLKVQLPPLDSFDSKIQVEEVVEIEISGEVSKGELLIICMCFLRMSFLLINVKY